MIISPDIYGIVDVRALRDCLPPGSACLVAVSGGPDSMCLLHVLHELSAPLGITLHVAHINHLMRGADALSDWQLVKEQCAKLAVPAYYREIEPLERKPRRKTVEEYFREQRHARLHEIARDHDLKCIALGHNADDLAETFLMHLMRGTGFQGLTFSFAQRHGDVLIIRPLWQTSRQRVMKHIASHGVPCNHDASNDSLDFTRNRVRNVLIPFLKREFNPSVTDALRRASSIIARAGDYLHQKARRRLRVLLKRGEGEHVLPTVRFLAQPLVLQYEIARLWLKRGCKIAPSYQHIESILKLAKSKRGREVRLPSGFMAVKNGGMILLVKGAEGLRERSASGQNFLDRFARLELALKQTECPTAPPLARIDQPLVIADPEAAKRFSAEIVMLDKARAILSLDVVAQNKLPLMDENQQSSGFAYPLVLRNRKPGDRVSPSVRLKTVLINDKAPYYVRDYLIVLADCQNRILAVAGLNRITARIQRNLDEKIGIRVQMLKHRQGKRAL
ncbi:MAG: tRNA lysidine(34) synthetase TilS [bacterium]